MRSNSWIRLFPVLLAVLSLVAIGCGNDVVKKLDRPSGRMEVAMEANSFNFEPAVIQAHKGTTLVLNITNTASRTHNFTIKDPYDRVVKSVDLPANQTTTVDVELKDIGVYHFWCDKFFHSTMGMKGRVDVMP